MKRFVFSHFLFLIPYLLFSQNIGIGNNSPGFPLTFSDNIGDKISLYGNSGPHYGFGIQGYLMQIHTGAVTDDIAFGYGSSSAFTETMRVRGNGNVGIGTTAPAAKLEITHNGASNFGTALLLNQTAIGNSDGPKIEFRKTMASTRSWTAGILNGVNVGSFSINEDGGTSGFGASRFCITAGGNVGIGATAPTEKLEVAGNIKAASFKFSTNKTYYYTIPPSAFRTMSGADIISVSTISAYINNTPTPVSGLAAPVYLPEGAIITSLTAYYYDNSSTTDILVKLSHLNFSIIYFAALATVTSSGTPGDGNSTTNTISFNQVTNQIRNYTIEVTSTSGPWPGLILQIRSVVIAYTLSEVN